MAALLRASGPDFDVDAFARGSRLPIAKIFRRGEPRGANQRGDQATRSESGLNVTVSNAGLHEFAKQTEDATRFLIDHADEVKRLVTFPGVAGVVLDFAIARRDVAAQSDHFPVELVRVAGECGIGLELSQYPSR